MGASESAAKWRGPNYRPGSQRWANRGGGENARWWTAFCAAKREGQAAVEKDAMLRHASRKSRSGAWALGAENSGSRQGEVEKKEALAMAIIVAAARSTASSIPR